MTDLDITAKPTRFDISALPEDDINAHVWTLTVEYRGCDLWAIRNGWGCLSRDGEWHHESLPSNREDEWLTEHRFPLDEALDRARVALPTYVINGMTVTDCIARRKAREAGP